TYASATVPITTDPFYAIHLGGVRFYSPDERTYSVRLNGNELAQVAVAAGATAEATFAPVPLASGDTLAIIPVVGGSARVSYLTGESNSVTPQVTLGSWAEAPPGFTVP